MSAYKYIGWDGLGAKRKQLRRKKSRNPHLFFLQFPKGRKESVPALVQGTDPFPIQCESSELTQYHVANISHYNPIYILLTTIIL